MAVTSNVVNPYSHIVLSGVEDIIPGSAFTLTGRVAVVVPHNPVDVAVIVAVPKNKASQSMTPVVPFIEPAVAGDTEYTIEVLFAAVAV